jgi:hypothetical protein
MKSKTTAVIIVLLLGTSLAGFGQVGNWPPNPSTFLYFGANELGQSNVGNYAVLQDKTNGTTFLNSPASIYFRIGNNDRMFLSSSGKIGIGTTSPISLLSNTNVSVGGTASDGFVWKSVQNDWTATINGSPTSGAGYGLRLHTLGVTSGDLPLLISSGAGTGTIKFLINGIGNVGIGTANPTAKLEVNGDIKVPRNEQAKAKIDFGAYSYLESRNVNGDGINGGNYGTAILRNAHIESHAANTYYNPNGYLQSQKIEMLAGNWSFDYRPAQWGTSSIWNQSEWQNRLFINGTTGNVGIGTTNPNQKLTVNGTIYGKEVKVDLNVPGPDYVFAHNYQLPTLTELKTYIDQHKHLPEVPSAAAMEANGINLGEMNMLLLKKIEELTLYVIELKKELTELRIENQKK